MRYRRFIYLFLMAATGLYIAFFGRRAEGPAEAPRAETIGRVVSLAPNLTELVFALGLEDRLAGVTESCTYPPAARDVKKAGAFLRPDVEMITALKPDMVLALDIGEHQQACKQLEKRGIYCMRLRIVTVNDFYGAVEKISSLTGTEEAGRAVLADIEQRIGRTAERVNAGGNADRPAVLFAVRRDPLRAAGRDTFINTLIEYAGGMNAVITLDQPYPLLEREEVIQANPDVIIESPRQGLDIETQLEQAREFWGDFAGVSAVKMGNIYVIEDETLLRLSPRLGQAVERLADFIMGEVPSDRNIEKD